LGKIGPFTPQARQSWPARLTGRLSQPQKIVVVLALGTALGAAGTCLAGPGSTSAFGWYACAPLSQAAYPATGLHGWARLLIWPALIGLWALLSVRVLRPSPDQAPHD
jgi:hypothetical protein